MIRLKDLHDHSIYFNKEVVSLYKILELTSMQKSQLVAKFIYRNIECSELEGTSKGCLVNISALSALSVFRKAS